MTDRFSNVSAISVREAVATAQRIIGLLGSAVQLTALITLVAGIAVLAGTVASTEAQQLADSVILKVLGATRLSIIIAWFFEYALLGVLTAFAATLIGSLASWALITQFLQADFVFYGKLVLTTSFAGAGATALLGLAGATTLGRKPAPLLREALGHKAKAFFLLVRPFDQQPVSREADQPDTQPNHQTLATIIE